MIVFLLLIYLILFSGHDCLSSYNEFSLFCCPVLLFLLYWIDCLFVRNWFLIVSGLMYRLSFSRLCDFGSIFMVNRSYSWGVVSKLCLYEMIFLLDNPMIDWIILSVYFNFRFSYTVIMLLLVDLIENNFEILIFNLFLIFVIFDFRLFRNWLICIICF